VQRADRLNATPSLGSVALDGSPEPLLHPFRDFSMNCGSLQAAPRIGVHEDDRASARLVEAGGAPPAESRRQSSNEFASLNVGFASDISGCSWRRLKPIFIGAA